jgi:hypothetical protein
MCRWSDLFCAFPNAAEAGGEKAMIKVVARRNLFMMVSFSVGVSGL